MRKKSPLRLGLCFLCEMSLSHIQRRHKVIARDRCRSSLRRLAEEIIAAKKSPRRKEQEQERAGTYSFGFRVWFHFLNESPLPEVLSDLHFHTHLFTFYNPNYQWTSGGAAMFPHTYVRSQNYVFAQLNLSDLTSYLKCRSGDAPVGDVAHYGPVASMSSL